MTVIRGMGNAFLQNCDIDPFVTASILADHAKPTEASFTGTGYFCGFDSHIAASIMQIHNELRHPLNPAFDENWAFGALPSLDIASSVERSNLVYRPSFGDLQNLVASFGDFHLEFNGEPVMPGLPHPLSVTLPKMSSFFDPEQSPYSVYDRLTSEIERSIGQEAEKRIIEDLIGFNPTGLFNTTVTVPHASVPWHKRKWEDVKGRARWARERFARRVYEWISEYDFTGEVEGVDW